MSRTGMPRTRRRSLPSRERGLKSRHPSFWMDQMWSLPSRERGLKCLENHFLPCLLRSLPLWERGLKSDRVGGAGLARESLPSRERGLKWQAHRQGQGARQVAPFTGAWIEISWPGWSTTDITLSLPSRERELKSPSIYVKLHACDVAPFTGAWIEMDQERARDMTFVGCSLQGLWLGIPLRMVLYLR